MSEGGRHEFSYAVRKFHVVKLSPQNVSYHRQAKIATGREVLTF
jgi:hypothetical protein